MLTVFNLLYKYKCALDVHLKHCGNITNLSCLDKLVM